MLFTLTEILDVLVTVVAASFIFMGFLDDVVTRSRTFAERLVLSAAVVGPAIVLHELGHKFTAMALGYDATFHASYGWLALGVVLKLISFPFLFVVPAYVAILGASGRDSAWIAFAGPVVNGLLALGSHIALKAKRWSPTVTALLYFSRTINLFLFVFNLLPIPGFDGYTFWTNIF